MENNLTNRDAYIDEQSDYSICSVENDPNRRNTQMLTDFLRGKKFACDIRPTVTIETIEFPKGIIDVIVVHNRLDTPFFSRNHSRTNFVQTIYM